ncbi:MAG: RNA-binding domain-containing protein [Nanoarchaeota archaeon]
MDNQYLKNIKTGMKVVVFTSRKKYSTGIVNEIAARTPFNEEGIMVRLKNGDVGRVKKIILNELEENEQNAAEIKKLIKQGESYHTEFKASAFWSITYNPEKIKESKSFELREYGQRTSKIIIAKSLAAFLNSDGGNLIIGVNENKESDRFEIVGIEEDMKKIGGGGTDQYKRVLIDEILRVFFPSKLYNHLQDYLSISFATIEGKTVCWIKIAPSDFKIFLKINNKDVFMIRVESENRTLDGEKLVDYCLRRWKGR